MEGSRMESGKYDQEWYVNPFKEPPIVPLFPRSNNTWLGCPGWPPRWNKEKSITFGLVIHYPTSTYDHYSADKCIKYGILYEIKTNVPHNVSALGPPSPNEPLLIECVELCWWGRGIGGTVGMIFVDMLITWSSGSLSSLRGIETWSLLVTPRWEGVTSGFNMGTCAHRKAHENLNIFGIPWATTCITQTTCYIITCPHQYYKVGGCYPP
jgi:hypothetical protein